MRIRVRRFASLVWLHLCMSASPAQRSATRMLHDGSTRSAAVRSSGSISPSAGHVAYLLLCSVRVERVGGFA